MASFPFSRLIIFLFLFLGFSPNLHAQTLLETVELGVLLPLSGSNAIHGLEAKKGIELSLEKNREGLKTMGVEINLRIEDDGLDPKKSLETARHMLREQNVQAIIGPFGSSEVLAVAPEVQKAGGVLVTASATSPSIQGIGDGIFRLVSNDNSHGKALARFAYQILRVRKAVIVYMVNEYGLGLKNAIEKKMNDLGGSILHKSGFEIGTRDFAPLIKKIKEAQPHCIFLTAYQTEGGHFIKQARDYGIRVPILGGDGLYNEDLIAIAGPQAEETYATTASWRPQADLAKTRDFVESFRNRFGGTPGVDSAYYYDAMEIVLSAIQKGARTSDEIKEAFYSQSFEGATGTIQFQNSPEAEKSVDLFKVENGVFQYFMTLDP